MQCNLCEFNMLSKHITYVKNIKAEKDEYIISTALKIAWDNERLLR